MHIPDGYLSPTTCALGYVIAAPVWYIALNKVQKRLNTRLVPLIAVFSAFCFVVMMFNLPVPGGTTAHAIGVAIAAIVLGPWAGLLAVSIALLIQALFFGDGGITTFAFNSFNMGIIGAWVAWWVYRLLAGHAALRSPRRVIAAALAGYVAINAAALAAAVELGVQPILFHTASGTPLYAPYPLSISIPAMMIAHLTLAGVAELVVTAGIVAWLQQSNPSLLQFSSGTSPQETGGTPRKSSPIGGWRITRTLWLGLAILMVITPLGLLTTAEAWGEWGPDDFARDNATIAAQSLDHAAPAQAPQGMQRLASIWTAPVPDYAPSFMRSESFGYILSALFGVGLIIIAFYLIIWLMERFTKPRPPRPHGSRG